MMMEEKESMPGNGRERKCKGEEREREEISEPKVV